MAAVQRPMDARAAPSAAAMGEVTEAEQAEHEQDKRAEERAERLHLAGLSNAAVIIMGVVFGAVVVMLVLVLISHH